MKFFGMRVTVIVVAFLLGLAVLFGGNWLFREYNYLRPLETILENNRYIDSFTVSNQGDTYFIEVMITDTSNLMLNYKELEHDVKNVLGDKTFKLILKDNRSETLSQIFYRSQYAVYEAIAKGNFQEMAEVVQREAKSAGASAEIYIDEDNVYLHLSKDRHYLNAVISRKKLPEDVALGMVQGSEGGWLKRFASGSEFLW